MNAREGASASAIAMLIGENFIANTSYPFRPIKSILIGLNFKPWLIPT